MYIPQQDMTKARLQHIIKSCYNRKAICRRTNHWRNVEMTGYVKVNAHSIRDDYAWYNRGGRHTEDSVPCEGYGYKGDLFLFW